ncbi:Crp/Fnr family transcriptional regulator [Candidatus Latescibacterota bacterium]
MNCTGRHIFAVGCCVKLIMTASFTEKIPEYAKRMRERTDIMGNTRRTVIKRRDDGQGKHVERRGSLKNPEEAIKKFKQIQMFKGLTTNQIMKILNIASIKKIKEQENIYCIGDESDSMFIILKGKISIMFNNGLELLSITPSGTVGEMGLFTGEKRSASVLTVTECTALFLSQKELFILFNSDSNLANKILLNVIKDLSKKMRKDNSQLEELLYRVRALDSL